MDRKEQVHSLCGTCLYTYSHSKPRSIHSRERAEKNKSTQVFNLRSICVSFGHPLALTCTQVFRRLATQRKSTQVDHKSSVHAWELQLFATCVNLPLDSQVRLATHRKSACKFWLCKLASCTNLRVHLARALDASQSWLVTSPVRWRYAS